MTVGYSGTPLPRKLSVTPTSRVLVLGTPAGFGLGAPHHVRAVDAIWSALKFVRRLT